LPVFNQHEARRESGFVVVAATGRRRRSLWEQNRGELHAMKLDRRRLKEQIHELYRSEHEAMGERGTLERLDRGREWDLAPTLAAGGVAVFPHAGVFDCGHQVAAVAGHAVPRSARG